MTTGLATIFNGALWGEPHVPLVLGWGDEQLVAVAGVLEPLLPGGLTRKMLLAVAACARSVVEGFLVSGRPVRYSRKPSHYSRPKRYQGGARSYSYHYVINAIDMLHAAGLIVGDRGEWGGSGGRGRQSVAEPTPRLLELLEPVVDLAEPRSEIHEAEVIVLRDRDDKHDIRYEDTDETNAMRAEVQALNAALGELRLFLHGRQRFSKPLLRRVFNGGFDRNGRIYCHGMSWQNIWAEDRSGIQVVVDEVRRPTVEIDYANQHAVMAYTEAGVTPPPGDQYAIDGFDRDLVKRAFNILLNAVKREKAVAALSEELRIKNPELRRRIGFTSRLGADSLALAERVITAVEDKHQPIAAYFASDCGARFMRRDSDMAVRVMQRVLAETGRCPLPVHDSFLVADLDQEVLARVMREVAAEEGLPLCLKDSTGHPR
jgi:hypothetical protein